MYSLAGRYDNPIPKWILAHIDCSKIKAQDFVDCRVSAETIFVNIGYERAWIIFKESLGYCSHKSEVPWPMMRESQLRIYTVSLYISIPYKVELV
jgi:hypothetical protein